MRQQTADMIHETGDWRWGTEDGRHREKEGEKTGDRKWFSHVMSEKFKVAPAPAGSYRKVKEKILALVICKHDVSSNYKDKYDPKLFLLIITFLKLKMKYFSVRSRRRVSRPFLPGAGSGTSDVRSQSHPKKWRLRIPGSSHV